MLTIIAAVGRNGELGRGGDLIWRIAEDLAFFRKTTQGHYIVMGRKTYDSMPKNLPDRRYLVISRTTPLPSLAPPQGGEWFSSVDEFLAFAHRADEEIFVVGGGTIYTQLLPHCDKLILTEIDDECTEADAYFPKFDKSAWRVGARDTLSAGGLKYQRVVYERKSRE